MKTNFDINLFLQSLKGKAAIASPNDGYWTTENKHDGKWSVYDAEGNSIAMAEQRTKVSENLKQTDRTANAEWIAATCPKRICELADAVKTKLDRLEFLEMLETSRHLEVTWQYSHWGDEWSAYSGKLIHFDTSERRSHVIEINGKIQLIEGVKIKLPNGTIIGDFPPES